MTTIKAGDASGAGCAAAARARVTTRIMRRALAVLGGAAFAGWFGAAFAASSGTTVPPLDT
ncbi:hypothetical protein ISG26_35355, partial [Burkholderia pseudomallei]|nr:hypothetical protein [Burkholderia pseudomallei]